ncbi:MAG: response regulator [Anaerolineae bacterium]|nr:response regulator [Anaerolineae bacterium]
MRKRVLVVDDVPDWRATLQDILKQIDECEVKAVDSYQAAMDVVKNREAELAIVDLRLSPTDESDRQGMELLKLLAEYRINAIVLTGYPENSLKEEAEEKYKIFEFIDKGELAGNFQRLRDIVKEAFSLMEIKDKQKKKLIQAASALQSVSFPKDLASWPLRNYRKKQPN